MAPDADGELGDPHVAVEHGEERPRRRVDRDRACLAAHGEGRGAARGEARDDRADEAGGRRGVVDQPLDRERGVLARGRPRVLADRPVAAAQHTVAAIAGVADERAAADTPRLQAGVPPRTPRAHRPLRARRIGGAGAEASFGGRLARDGAGQDARGDGGQEGGPAAA